ncbi:MAG: hypothetical protein M5U26_29165 [Planctomycetota bacterium]|nr:hypothetical protein [Planctomycetota bacterium]
MAIPTEYGAAYVKLRTLIEAHPETFALFVTDFCNLDAPYERPKKERVAWMVAGLELLEVIHGREHVACTHFLLWLAADAEPKQALEYLSRAHAIGCENEAGLPLSVSFFAHSAARACFALGLKEEGFKWVVQLLQDDLKHGTDTYWELVSVETFLPLVEDTGCDVSAWLALEADLLKRDGRTAPAGRMMTC